MKILLLPDFLDNWSCANRCKALAKYLPQHQFTIRAENEHDPAETWRLKPAEVWKLAGWRRHEYFKKVRASPRCYCVRDHEAFDIIHFNFTTHITAYRDFFREHSHRCLVTIVNERAWFDGFGVDGTFRQLIRSLPWKTSVNPRVAEASGATYIPNGIDPDIFDDWKRPVVGYAGTNAPRKNGKLVQAVCDELGLTLRTAIYAGDTPNQPIPHERMPEWYRGLDVYVHASESEGCNNTILEALASGVPVLMTRVGCWQEFEGFVEFIEPTAKSIKAALQKWCGRRLIDKRFLWATHTRSYGALYEEISRANRVRAAASAVCGGAPA